MPEASLIQIAVCLGITVAIALATWATLRRSGGGETHDGSKKDVYLAGGKLSWLFVAGAITLTVANAIRAPAAPDPMWLGASAPHHTDTARKPT